MLKCGVPASSMHCRDWLTQEPGGRPRAWLPITCRSHAASSPKNTGSLVSILQDTYAYAGALAECRLLLRDHSLGKGLTHVLDA